VITQRQAGWQAYLSHDLFAGAPEGGHRLKCRAVFQPASAHSGGVFRAGLFRRVDLRLGQRLHCQAWAQRTGGIARPFAFAIRPAGDLKTAVRVEPHLHGAGFLGLQR